MTYGHLLVTQSRDAISGNAQVVDIMVRPERLLRGLRPLVLRFAPDRRHASRDGVQPGADAGFRYTACRTRLVVCREFELQRPALGTDEWFSDTESNGAPGEIRTPGLLVRSQALYPTELRAHRRSIQFTQPR
jgi:hypothetical protein